MNRDAIINSLLENMNLTKRSMTSYMHAVMSNLPISPAQLEMLHVIRHLQPVSSKKLAQDRQLTPGAISQLTDALVQHNLVERVPDLTDRRTHTLKTTKTGDKLLRSIQKRREELFRRVMFNFDDNELQVWLKIQNKVIRELEKEKDTSLNAEREPNT